ncbi:2',3'-cyclic-nucleotide 3'-phosphodiesterase [Lipomyces kononenkoae]|uniref:2',3'-cyclic-nucleotide 3'-phosphodiesterase n=1 Tax=Lipomyces kononenkoae TaxID=34357 RepID=A0ACC3T4I9_LIPKO
MPGLSLWLSPPPSSPIYKALESLIGQLSDDLFPPSSKAPKFSPHITLTSDIPVDVDPDAVVRSVSSLASPRLQIDIGNVAYGPAYFKKIYLRIAKTPDLIQLAGESRRIHVYLSTNDNKSADKAEAMAREWQSSEYDPHLSLVYSDEWPITDNKKIDIQARLESLFDQVGTSSWVGGRISLVKTLGPVETWQVLACQDL